MLGSLEDLDVSPATLERRWQDEALPFAVHKNILTNCFGNPLLAQSHAECAREWDRLVKAQRAWLEAAPADRQGPCPDPWREFYCAGTINQCHGQLYEVVDKGTGELTKYRPTDPHIKWYQSHNIGFWVDCGCEWFGLDVEDEETGQIIHGRCPRCGKEYEAAIMQEYQWWQGLTHIIAKETKAWRDKTGTIGMDWTLRLTKVIQAGRLFTFPWAPGIAGYENQADALRAELQQAGLEDDSDEEKPKFPTDLYDLVNWAVLAPDAFKYLGWANWEQRTADWSLYKRRMFVPTLRDALVNKFAGRPAPEGVAKIMEAPKTSHKERLRQVRSQMEKTPAPTPRTLFFWVKRGRYGRGKKVRLAVVPLRDDRDEAELMARGLQRKNPRRYAPLPQTIEMEVKP